MGQKGPSKLEFIVAECMKYIAKPNDARSQNLIHYNKDLDIQKILSKEITEEIKSDQKQDISNFSIVDEP